jgi:hypothetical protein
MSAYCPCASVWECPLGSGCLERDGTRKSVSLFAVPSRKSIDERYEEAARRLGRVTVVEAYEEMGGAAVLVDTRSPD